MTIMDHARELNNRYLLNPNGLNHTFFEHCHGITQDLKLLVYRLEQALIHIENMESQTLLLYFLMCEFIG
jgi:hypothetical protein